MNEEELKISILDEVLSKERTKDKLKIEEIIRIEPITSPEIRGWLYEAICLGFQKGKIEQKKEELEFLNMLDYNKCLNCEWCIEAKKLFDNRIKQLQKEIGGNSNE